jgi:hypothetical protein
VIRAGSTLMVTGMLTLAMASGASAAIPSGELLKNAGAEDAPGSPSGATNPPVPNWVAGGTFTAIAYGASDFPTLDEGSRVGGGSNFFAGGPNAAVSTGDQTVDLRGAAAEIDSGRVPATLSGFIGGYASQTDNAQLVAKFIDGSGNLIRQLQIGPVTPVERNNVTSLLYRNDSADVPVGTRSVFVQFIATRLQGTSNDGYADNLSFRLEAPPPAPVFAKSVTLTPVSGTVLVRLPGSQKFVSVAKVRSLPVGSIVDARKGRVRLQASDGKGGTQFADFFEGVFKLLQPKGGKGLVELDLFGGNFKSCPAGLRASGAASPKSKSVRHLWGQGSGKFRTVGRFASATLRGTTWLTNDRCDGTQIRVTTGAVTVRDLVKRRNVVVTAPGKYFAAARKR